MDEITPVVPTAPKNDAGGGGSTLTFNNNILFYKDVNADSIAELNSKIMTAKNNIEKACIDLGLYNIVPINLYIHSNGGSLLAGFAAADIIVKENVNTHIQGAAGSAASIMSVCGKHRTMTKHSFILIHQLSTSYFGTFSEFEDNQTNINNFMKMLEDIYLERTNIPKDKLKEILRHDLWLDAPTALEYGMIDEIV